MPPEHCPNTATCPFYANWLDYTRNPRTDIVLFQVLPKGSHYGCLTLIALEDAERGGIPIGEELAEELSDPEKLERLRRTDCPLKSLNRQNIPNYLENKISDLVNLLKQQNA